jgi:hypothetical protein
MRRGFGFRVQGSGFRQLKGNYAQLAKREEGGFVAPLAGQVYAWRFYSFFSYGGCCGESNLTPSPSPCPPAPSLPLSASDTRSELEDLL